MTSLNTRERDDFLKALEEARKASLREEDAEPSQRASGPPLSSEFLRVIDHMAGKVRSYVSAHLLSRLYAENSVRSAASDPQPQPPPPPPRPKSDHDAVMEELHLTPGLSAADLVRLRREFAKSNHPDRVPSPAREVATRRMTIANCIIDEALRTKKPRPQ